MDDFDLKEIREIIKKRKSFLMIFILVATLITALYSFIATPVYEAKTRVLVNMEKPAPLNLANNVPNDFKGKEFFETQVALIKSRSLIRNVIKQLNLRENPEFKSDDSVFLTDLGVWFKSLSGDLGFEDTSSESFEPDPYSVLIDEMMERMQVKQVKTSRVLEISFRGKSPPLVADITNALTHEYMAKTLGLYNASDGTTTSWINSKLRDLNIKLKKSEKKLRQFKQKRSYIEAKGGRDLVSKKWGEISQELTKAASARLNLETQIQELRALRDDPLKLLLSQPFVFNNTLSELQKNYISLNNELGALLKSKTSEHPDVALLTKKLHLLKQKIPSEVDNFISSFASNLKAAINREKALERALRKQQKVIMKTDNDFLEFRFLKQEVELNGKLYNEILNRKKELEITSNFNSSNISIVDIAEIPYIPIKPKKGRNIILSILLSTFAGFLLIFFLESQDKSIKAETDLDHHHPYFFWGSIAKIPKENLSAPFSTLRDFRSLKIQFLLKTKNSASKIFLITSPTPNEGKSFITSHLAVSLGNSGKTVLIIDADLFNPKIASILKGNQKPGFLDDLRHIDNVAHQTKFNNVWVVSPGKTNTDIKKPKNVSFSPSLQTFFKERKAGNKVIPDVLLSNDFQAFLKEAERRWDYVFIKAPPVLATPDAKVIEKYCHGIILVLQSGTHDPVSVQKIFNQFTFMQSKHKTENNGKPRTHESAKLMGVVINKIDRRYKKIEYSYYQNLG